MWCNWKPTNTATDAGLIPTGEKAPVAGTPMDFTKPPRSVPEWTLIFRPSSSAGLRPLLGAASRQGRPPRRAVSDPESGRVMEVSTNQPAVSSTAAISSMARPRQRRRAYEHRTALCLETENFPTPPTSRPPDRRPQTRRNLSPIMVHKFSVKK